MSQEGMNQGWTYCDRVKPSAAGQTVLAYYTQRYQHSSGAQWQERIERGQVLLNGQSTTEGYRLRAGQALSYYRLPWQEPEVPLDFGVLYEDDDLWVIDKPSGLPVLPGGGFLEHTLLHQLRRCYPQVSPIPVHRLGRGTSGAMLVAKSQVAREGLSRQFRRRTVVSDQGAPSLTKVYRALVGPMCVETLPSQFSCAYPIGKLPHERLGYVYGNVAHKSFDGCELKGNVSYSEVTVLERRAEATVVAVAIKTGRPHQIRIHLAAAGVPLLGDPLYVEGGVVGADLAVNPGDCGYCLHAYQLGFLHPVTGAGVLVSAPLPSVLRCAGD